MTKPYRVLSIDGGGVRGLYPACLLHGLAQRVARSKGQAIEDNLDIGNAFDMIVGTSTGAILAVALAAGRPLEEVIQLYQSQAKEIFPSPTPPRSSVVKFYKWVFAHRNKPSGSPSALKTALDRVLKEETVGEMFKRRGVALCVPSVDAQTQKAWVYKTPHDHENERLQRDNNYKLVDVCMSSASAPVMFPLHNVKDPNSPSENHNWFVDGGLWANNPVMVALVEALSFAPQNAPIELISVSTCPPFNAPPIESNNANRGILDWRAGIGMLEMGLDAQSSAYAYMAKALTDHMGGRIKYVRLSDPPVDENIARDLSLDNPSKQALDTLVKLASRAVDQNISEATTGDQSKALIMQVFSGLSAV